MYTRVMWSVVYSILPTIPVTLITTNATLSRSLAPGASETFWYNSYKCGATVTESIAYLRYILTLNSWSNQRLFEVILG
jgi:hypothetical protein